MNKTQLTALMKKDENIKSVKNWFPNNEKRLVLEPKGYDDKKFSMKSETISKIQNNGWQIYTFYDGFVEIEKTQKQRESEKLQKIENILWE